MTTANVLEARRENQDHIARLPLTQPLIPQSDMSNIYKKKYAQQKQCRKCIHKFKSSQYGYCNEYPEMIIGCSKFKAK